MCVASIASINNFKNTAVNSIRQGYTSDPRPHLILEVDGQDIGFLYDSGAQVNTIARSLFDQYFSNRPSARYRPHVGPSILGAGQNNMGYSDCYTMPVKFKGKTYSA